MSGEQSTRATQRIRTRLDPDASANLRADCPHCGKTHDASSDHKARLQARQCCDPNVEYRIWCQTTEHSPDDAGFPSAEDAMEAAGFDSDQTSVYDHQRYPVKNGWEVQYELVGVTE